MQVRDVAIKVLHIFVACLVMGSSLGWFAGSVIASSRTQAPDFYTYSGLTQNVAIDSSPIASNPFYSPADGTWEVTGTIQLSGTERPLQIAVAGGKAYMSRNPGHLTVLDLSTNAVITTISFDSYPGAAPHYIGILGDKAYVALSNLGSDGQLAVINIANNTVAGYIPVGADPYGVATFGQKVYVTNNVWWSSGDPATVNVVDANTNSVVATIPVGINPTGIAVDPVSRKAYVTNRNDLSKSVSVIDTNANAVIATIPINNPPAGVAISGNRAYITTVVNMPNGTVEVIDISADSIVSSIPVGRDSWGVAASDSYVFVANQSSSTVSVIEVATNSVVATVNVGDDPTHVAVDPSTNKVYVSNQGDNTISVIEFIGTPPPSNQQPTVSITTPSNNVDVSGIINVQGTASDPDGSAQLQKVEVKIDAGSWVQASGTTSWSYSWDTTTTSNGQHSIYARSYDGQAYSSETSVVVTVSNQAVAPSIIDVGITAETILPPEIFLQAEPGDRFVAWYDIAYSGPRITVQMRTTIIDSQGGEIHNPLGDPGLALMEDMPGHTGWVGDDFKIPDAATLGTYSVKFSVWSEDGSQQYDALVKSGWLRLGLEEKPDISSVASINFGNITVGSNSDKTTTINNDGSTTLTINSVTRTAGSPDFIYIIPSTPFNIEAGGSQTITIRFAPSLEGSQSATFNINSNDPDETNITFNVSGSSILQKGTINVTSNPSGASFALSGPVDYSGITPWSKTDAPVGTYTITWTSISGYQAPPQDDKTLTQSGVISFEGNYQVAKGTIEVNSNPPGASFTLSGPANYDGITPWSKADAPLGVYTITWAPLSGYQTPLQQSQTLTQGGAISFHSNYKLSTGTIQVTSDPSGASFTLSGPADYSGKTPWSKTNALAGKYIITWGFVSGYEAPPQESETLTQNGMLSFYGDYTVKEAFPGANAATLWDYYSAWGKQLPPLSERAKIYEALGLGAAGSYTGTAEQNTRLLNALKERRICPVTANEINGVVSATTLARLIKQETQERTSIIVDGEEYYVVTLKRYIEPIERQPFEHHEVWKVYVDSSGEPIRDKEIVERISLVRKANHLMSNIGSPVEISKTLETIDEVLAAHEELTDAENLAMIAQRLASITVDVAIGDITNIVSDIALDILKVYADPVRARADLGSGLLTRARWYYESAEGISREQWTVALEIDETGYLRQKQENFRRVTDSERASLFLRHFYTAYLMFLDGTGLVLPYERIGKSAYLEVLEWVPQYFGDKISLQFLSIVQLGKKLTELRSTIEEDLRRIDSISQKVGEEMMAGLGRFGDYTLALAHRNTSYMKELPLEPYIYANVASPVELRVRDTEGRITGVINGQIRMDIPDSYYFGNSVVIFSPSDSFRYEVVGTSEGSYGLTVTTVDEEINTFIREKEPTSAKVVHQYTVDWKALSEGKKGVTMKIDSDGDGTFEEIRKLGREGVGFSWVWIAVAGVSGLLGVLAGAFIVRRHMGKKQTA